MADNGSVTVWDALVGQDAVVSTLTAAAEAAALVATAGPLAAARAGMTHSWLFTGPAGSGLAEAARAFAAGLLCESTPPGCGQCPACHTVLSDTAADLRTVRPEGLSIGVRDVRALIRDAASAPSAGSWRILLIDDADRFTDSAANALLKALEEPAERAVFLLCAPSVDDVLPTIRSRCRSVALRLPTVEDVVAVLVREGADEELARVAAQASQGHVGQARRLAADPQARARREAVLRLPSRLRRTGDCLAAAADLVEAATADAQAAGADRDEAETEALKTALGVGATSAGTRSASARGGGRAGGGAGAKPRSIQVRGAAGALKELERAQKSRGRRTVLDSLDRALVDLAGLYRDVLVSQLRAEVALVHPDHAEATAQLASAATPEQTLRRWEAVLATRQALADNPGLVPQLATESLALALRDA
ncbi:DNA polymerase-3 subunit delta' [Parafrankia irregularis]|uniref:DNA polymerase III subunit delta' n=1 Tax=Parafrankia irregularis TaxID=795642 RepID=A0A0S4QS22_9ACTN|nr:DNA polymerase III subunit delta' [Parafrankia irregularis]CUU58401.1 DNA polymerase-3 subunit delta' [Parafrankia irregularis]